MQSVILNVSSGLNRKSRRQKTLSRKRKVAVADCQGVYNQKWHDGPATIQLFVDNIIGNKPIWIFKILFFRRLIFAEVLFLKLWHHILYTAATEFKDREDVAEVCRKRLTKEYNNKRYRYLKPLKPLLRFLLFVISLLIKSIDFITKRKKTS